MLNDGKVAVEISDATSATSGEVRTGTIWEAKSARRDGTRKQVVITKSSKQHVGLREATTGKSQSMRRSLFLTNYKLSNGKADSSLWSEATQAGSVVVGPEMKKLRRALDQQQRALIVNVIWKVTPALAAELVATAEGRNRQSSDARIRVYRQDQEGGNWVPTHQGIALGPDMDLIDGEHRCRTVMVTGVEVDVQVSQYTSREHCEVARKNLDGQHTRTKAHVLEIDGLVERGKGKAVAATIDAMRLVDDRIPKDLTKTQLEEVFKQRKASIAAVLSRVNKEFHSGVRGGLVIAHMKTPEKVEELIEMVATRVNITPNSAGQVMCKRLAKLQGGGSRSEVIKAIRQTLALCMIHAKGRKVSIPNRHHAVTERDIEVGIKFYVGDHYRAPTVEPEQTQKATKKAA
jgi:hypothetical protein